MDTILTNNTLRNSGSIHCTGICNPGVLAFSIYNYSYIISTFEQFYISVKLRNWLRQYRLSKQFSKHVNQIVVSEAIVTLGETKCNSVTHVLKFETLLYYREKFFNCKTHLNINCILKQLVYFKTMVLVGGG